MIAGLPLPSSRPIDAEILKLGVMRPSRCVAAMPHGCEKRVHTCLYLYTKTAMGRGLRCVRDGGYPSFSVTKTSYPQRVYRKSEVEDLEFAILRRSLAFGHEVFSRLSQSSRRPVNYLRRFNTLRFDCARFSHHLKPRKRTAHLRSRRLRHCGTHRSCYFFKASRSPANSENGRYSSSLRMRTKVLTRVVPVTGQCSARA